MLSVPCGDFLVTRLFKSIKTKFKYKLVQISQICIPVSGYCKPTYFHGHFISLLSLLSPLHSDLILRFSNLLDEDPSFTYIFTLFFYSWKLPNKSLTKYNWFTVPTMCNKNIKKKHYRPTDTQMDGERQTSFPSPFKNTL